MADIENKHQVCEGLLHAEPVASRRWFKLGTALFCGVSLALLYVTAQSDFGSTNHMTNSEFTNLVGLSPHLRQSSVPGKPSTIHAMGDCVLPGCGPFQKLAISAIKAHNEGRRIRDVAMMANMDPQTKEVMARVESAVNSKAKDMSGVTEPMGFWDPVGISTNIPEGKLLFFREAELKHGRVAMLASLGILVGEKYHPWFGVGDIPSAMVFQKESLNFFWVNLFVLCFFLESVTYKNYVGGWNNEMKPGFVPGDLGFDPLGIKPKDAKAFKTMQTREINNGRLAMFASLGMLAQELVTNEKIDPSVIFPTAKGIR